MEILMEYLIELIVLIVGVLVTRYLVPYLKERYGAERVANVYDMVEFAVKAAAKMFPESGMGNVRKEYVINYIRSKGIKITTEDLDVFIESAVKVLDILEDEVKK